MTLQTLQKQSYEERLFYADFVNLMPKFATLSTIVSIVSVNQNLVGGSANITFGAQSISGTIAQVLVIGGTDGEKYKVTFKVTDSAGEKLEGEGYIQVLDT